MAMTIVEQSGGQYHVLLIIADGQEANDLFEYCDIVTTTTHKSLRGPRSGMIFYRKGPKLAKKGQPEGAVYDYEDKINFAVFPSLQGGPHNPPDRCTCAVALKQAMTPGFKVYAKQVKANAVALGEYLKSKGYKIVTDGTENHLVLWDLRPLGLTGNKVEKLCDLANITVNKNAVFGDSSALAPGGVRIGTCISDALFGLHLRTNLYHFSWRLSLMAFPFLLLLIISGFIYGKDILYLSSKARSDYANANALVAQALSSIKTVYSFTAEKRILERYAAILDRTVKLGLKQGIAKGLAVGSTGLSFGIWAFLAWYGSRLVMYHGESGGRIYAAGISFVLGGL